MSFLTCVLPFLVLAFLHVQVTQATSVIIDVHPPGPQSCCFADQYFQHGEVVLSLQLVCLQLVCDDGKVVRRYLGEPGRERNCCEFDGQLYFEGVELTSHCVTLQCRDSCWHPFPTIADCCTTCTAYNDPHFVTFDGHKYDFHGFCNYTMTQRSYAHFPELGVFSDFESCFGEASCLTHTTFRNDDHTVITLSNGDVFNVLVNGHPFHVAQPNKVYALKSSEGCHPVLAWRSPYGDISPNCLTLLGSSRIMLQHCPHRLDIIVHASHTDSLDGLCGHFNDNLDDDFTSRGGQVYPLSFNPLGFPNSWKTLDQSNSMCQAPCRGCDLDSTPSPCTASAKAMLNYFDMCNSTLFSLIQKLPHLSYYIDNCAFDLCMIASYAPSTSTQLDHWLTIMVDIVTTAIYLHDNTEGNGGDLYTAPPTITSSEYHRHDVYNRHDVYTAPPTITYPEYPRHDV